MPDCVGRDRALARDQPDLHAQELVEDQALAAPPAPRPCARAGGSRGTPRRATRARGRPRDRGDRIGEAALRAPAQRVLHELRHLPGRDVGLARLRIDRHDLSGAIGLARRGRPRRRPGSSSAACRGTRRPCRRARPRCSGVSCRSRHAWLKNVHVRYDVPSLTTTSTSARPLRVRRPCTRAHLAEHRRLLADRERGDLRPVRAVDVAARVVLEHVEHRLDAHDREPFLERGPDARQPARRGSRAARAA